MCADSQLADLAGIFRSHFGHRDHLYGVLLDRLADDLLADGPTANICRDHLATTRADAIQLRLLAGIFRIVLRGDAPELAGYYPSLDGTAPVSEAWPVLQPLLVRHARLAAALDTLRAHPVVVDKAPAPVWLREQLAHPVPDDMLTVVWTSITQQYWPSAEAQAVQRAVSDARDRMPLSWITLEGAPPGRTQDGYDIVAHGPQLRWTAT